MNIQFINASIPGSQTDEIGVANKHKIAITKSSFSLYLTWQTAPKMEIK